ncbi:MAG: LysM peptidoglycan-binding domain-containing protein [Albidovulum sp.]
MPKIDTRVVVRGDNLWQISRTTYGQGIRYTVIYKANRDQIRDPDLIYPGQIFVLPKQRP